MVRLFSRSNSCNIHLLIFISSIFFVCSNLILAHELANSPSRQTNVLPDKAHEAMLHLAASQHKASTEKGYDLSTESTTGLGFQESEASGWKLRSEDSELMNVESLEDEREPEADDHHSSKQTHDIPPMIKLDRRKDRDGPNGKEFSTFQATVQNLIAALVGISRAIGRWIKCHPYRTFLIISPIIIKGALMAVGFQTAGVLGGSLAASIHSYIGNVAAGSTFAHLQSIGARLTWHLLMDIQVQTLLVSVILSLGEMAFEFAFGEDRMLEILRKAWEKVFAEDVDETFGEEVDKAFVRYAHKDKCSWWG